MPSKHSRISVTAQRMMKMMILHASLLIVTVTSLCVDVHAKSDQQGEPTRNFILISHFTFVLILFLYGAVGQSCPFMMTAMDFSSIHIANIWVTLNLFYIWLNSLMVVYFSFDFLLLLRRDKTDPKRLRLFIWCVRQLSIVGFGVAALSAATPPPPPRSFSHQHNTGFTGFLLTSDWNHRLKMRPCEQETHPNCINQSLSMQKVWFCFVFLFVCLFSFGFLFVLFSFAVVVMICGGRQYLDHLPERCWWRFRHLHPPQPPWLESSHSPPSSFRFQTIIHPRPTCPKCLTLLIILSFFYSSFFQTRSRPQHESFISKCPPFQPDRWLRLHCCHGNLQAKTEGWPPHKENCQGSKFESY